jgi:hypothetical protein
MSATQKPERQAKDLRLTAGESEFRIDPENAQRPAGRFVQRGIDHRKRNAAADRRFFNFGGGIQIVIALQTNR